MKLNGPKVLKYYSDPIYRLDWELVKDLPEPWKAKRGRQDSPGEFWIARHDGRVVGEMWQGRTGLWYALLYGRTTIWGPVQHDIALMMVGLVTSPGQ